MRNLFFKPYKYCRLMASILAIALLAQPCSYAVASDGVSDSTVDDSSSYGALDSTTEDVQYAECRR